MSDATSLFVETKQHRRFHEFCESCCREGYIGLCYGSAGVGKTMSARYYTNPKKATSPKPFFPSDGRLERGPLNKVILYTPSVVNTPGQIGRDLGTCRKNFTTTLLYHVTKKEEPKLDAMKQNLETVRRIPSPNTQFAEVIRQSGNAYLAAQKQYQTRRRETKDAKMLVVIDEAERLKMASLEQVRAIYDQGGMGLVLIGMPGLEKQMARYAQLYSRVGFVHEFGPLAEQELRGLLHQGWKPPGITLPSEGVCDEQTLAAILRITSGNFRLLNRLLTQIARVLVVNNLSQVTPAVVEVARESLVIGST